MTNVGSDEEMSEGAKLLYAERLRVVSGLVVAEYTALKSGEVLALQGAAQTTRWFTSTFGVGLGLGLVAIYTSLEGKVIEPTMLDVLIFIVFGATLPGLACVAAWSWLGDLHRLERTGAQVRSIELRISRTQGMEDLIGVDPIRLERYIATEPLKKDRIAVKSMMPYVATSGLFFGALLLSSSIYAVWNAQRHDFIWFTWPTNALVCTCAIFAIFFVVVGVIVRSIYILHGSIPDMTLSPAQDRPEARRAAARRGRRRRPDSST